MRACTRANWRMPKSLTMLQVIVVFTEKLLFSPKKVAKGRGAKIENSLHCDETANWASPLHAQELDAAYVSGGRLMEGWNPGNEIPSAMTLPVSFWKKRCSMARLTFTGISSGCSAEGKLRCRQKLLNEACDIIVKVLIMYGLARRERSSPAKSCRDTERPAANRFFPHGHDEQGLCRALLRPRGLSARPVPLPHLPALPVPRGQGSIIILLPPLLVKSLCSFCYFTPR